MKPATERKSMRRPCLSLVCGLAASVLMPWATLADVPAALDRAPAESPVLISVHNVNAFVSHAEAFSKTLPKETMKGIEHMKEVLKTPGINADGSAAIAVLSLDDSKGGKPPLVAILPVKDYAAFAKSFGGTGAGLEEIKIEGKEHYAKSIDGGFAALSEDRELLVAFAGKTGNGAAIEKMIGANGKHAAEDKDIVVITNLQALAPKIKDAMEHAKDQMKQMGQMAGNNKAEGNLAMIDWIETGLTRDGQAGVLAVSLGEKGVSLDLAGQFKEGSEFASYFSGKGKGGSLAGTLPNDAFLFAFAMDASSPGLKKMFGQIGEIMKKAGGAEVFGGMNPMALVDKMDGFSFFFGESPAPIGGLFLNTSYFVRSSDPAAFAKATRDMMTGLNGKKQNGITFTTNYADGAEKIGDAPADAWSMKMQADPNVPGAGMVGQMQQMLFGPAGMQGYIVQSKEGVLLTYAKNKDLAAKALAAAKDGNGLTKDAGVKSVGAELPKDRTMEGYIGVKSIMNTVVGFMGMMGGGPADLKIPQDLPPIGFGGTTDQGGVRVAVHVPAQVIKAVRDMGQAMKGGGDEDAEDMDQKKDQKEGAGQPKF
jgi:hypothetical protein